MTDPGRIRRLVDALEECLDDFQSTMLERHGDLSVEYEEAKRCYRLAAGLAVEFDRRDNLRRNASRHQSVPGTMTLTTLQTRG